MSKSISMKPLSGFSFNFLVLFVSIYILGVFLRLYQISGQILLDDEWHALNFAIGHSLGYILSHFSRTGANIIPINAYVRMLLISTGWSEILLVLPSILAGIAALIVSPLIVRRYFGSRVSLLFAFMMAISPMLIFYSRVCRPYAIYMLFGLICIWLFYEWTRTGNGRYGLLYVGFSVLCIYFHFAGVIFVFAPLGCAVLVKLLKEVFSFYGICDEIKPSFKKLFIAGIGIMACLALLIALALIQRLPALASRPAQLSLESLKGFLQILSGTTNVPINILFYIFLGIGMQRLFRKSILLLAIFISVFLAYATAILIIRVNFAHVPLVLARYAIPGFPLAFVLTALGMDSLWKMTQGFFPKLNKTTNALLTAGTLMFLFALLWTGPLRQTYATPNNFTSHSAFQESYAPMNWNHPRSSDMIRKSYTVNKENVPVFYKTLADNNNAQKIIEYPLFLGNHYNPFYYYQHFHGKKVAAGYTLAVKDKTDNMNRGVHASMFADQVLSRVDDPDRLKFRNLVNILDMAAVKNSQADFVVLHKNIFSEIFDYREGENGKDFPIIVAINRVYKKIFGSPSFEGQDLVVYKVRD